LSLQACRAVAALLVGLFHLGLLSASDKYFGIKSFGIPFSSGYTGVGFFFVLSGFIITFIHWHDIGKRSRLASYLQKRTIRIYPTYWIVFGGVAIVAMLIPELRASVPHDWITLSKALTLFPMYLSGQWGGAPVLIVAWTLQYEVCFYGLFGVLILSRFLGIVVIGALAINYGACQFGDCSFPRTFFSSNLVLLFGLGALAACFCKSRLKLRHPRSIAALGVAAFISAGALEAAMGKAVFPLDQNLVYGLFSVLIIVGLVQAEDAKALEMKSRWPALCGDASYSFYLIHHPLMVALFKLALIAGLRGSLGAAVSWPIILGICVVAALAFHILVEKPVLLFLRGRSGQRVPESAFPTQHATKA
jgi:exopolysaccharide production protein ExoZ